MAHNGVLFLDEFTEFPRKVLDVLREPMEAGEIVISRAARQCTYPAKFQLVAALNPSPSGDISDRRSSTEQILRYLNRISGPLLDRIDLQVDVPRLEQDELASLKHLPRLSSKDYRQKVMLARERQAKRGLTLNAHFTVSELENMANLSNQEQAFLYNAVQKLGLSMRSMHRIIRVSMTIADLEGASKIVTAHIAEALGYRALERLIKNLTR